VGKRKPPKERGKQKGGGDPNGGGGNQDKNTAKRCRGGVPKNIVDVGISWEKRSTQGKNGAGTVPQKVGNTTCDKGSTVPGTPTKKNGEKVWKRERRKKKAPTSGHSGLVVAKIPPHRKQNRGGSGQAGGDKAGETVERLRRGNQTRQKKTNTHFKPPTESLGKRTKNLVGTSPTVGGVLKTRPGWGGPRKNSHPTTKV